MDKGLKSKDEKQIVIGLGNPLLGDDGVGWRIAQSVQLRLQEIGEQNIEVDCLSVGGLSLMERMIGYHQVILTDSIATGNHPLGAVMNLTLQDLPAQAAGHIASAHDTNLQTALKVGHSLGADLPAQVDIVAVEAICLYEFSEELTPPIADAVPLAVEEILKLIRIHS